MSNTIGGSPVLPDIDEQIQYVKHLRKDVIPRIKNLQTELDMVIAIEQSLMAAKLLVKSENNELQNSTASIPKAIHILNLSKIKPTAVRAEVLKYIFSKGEEEFTVSEIFRAIAEYRPISKTAVIATILLFDEKGLIEESETSRESERKIGRPEAKFRYLKEQN